VPLAELSPRRPDEGAILAKAEIATITGHSLRDVRSILDAQYLHRDRALAESAIRKLEMGYAQRLAEVKNRNGFYKMTDKTVDRVLQQKEEKLIGSIGWGTRIRT
jgi:hypothetical protein